MVESIGKTAPESQKLRGTIIVDASALLKMWVAIPLEDQAPHRRSPRRTYLELIESLARDGFRIIIPEICSEEASGVLYGGTSIKDNFPKSSLKPAAGTLIPFMQKVAEEQKRKEAKGEIPPIRIERPQKGSPSLEYIRELRVATRIPDKVLAGKTIEKLQAEEGREHLGDEEIRYMVGHGYAPRDHPEGIFVLAHDIDLEKWLERKQTEQCTPQQLIHCLKSSKLLNYVGLNDGQTVSAAAMCHRMYTMAHDSERSYSASMGLNAQVSDESVKQLAFYGKLAELAKDKGIGGTPRPGLAATTLGEAGKPAYWGLKPGDKPPPRGRGNGSGSGNKGTPPGLR